MDDEITTGSYAIIAWGIAGILVFIIGGFIYFSVLPSWRNMETQGIQGSYQYIQSKQTLLLKLHTDYNRLESEIATQADQAVVEAKQRQQAAILTRMRTEANLLTPGDVPRDVAQFLQEHHEL